MSAGEEKPHIRVVVAEVEAAGHYLITQRLPQASMPLLWEFPGGKVAPGESDEDALRRALYTRLGVGIVAIEKTLEVSHEYTGYTLDLISYRAALRGEPIDRRVNAHRWVSPDEFGEYEFPGADQRTVDMLLQEE